MTQETSQYTYDFHVEASPEAIWSYTMGYSRDRGMHRRLRRDPAGRRKPTVRSRSSQETWSLPMRMPLEIAVLEMKERESLKVRIKGSDKKLRREAFQHIAITLEQTEPSHSTVAISADLELSGMLATLGKTLVRQQFAKQIEDFVFKFRKSILDKVQNS